MFCCTKEYNLTIQESIYIRGEIFVTLMARIFAAEMRFNMLLLLLLVNIYNIRVLAAWRLRVWTEEYIGARGGG